MKNANNVVFYRASIHCPHCWGPIDVEVPLKSVEARIARLENALEEIERKGHREGYHGKGYSLADIAEAALREDE